MLSPDGKFLGIRGNDGSPEIAAVDGDAPPRVVKGAKPTDRFLQLTEDGRAALVADFTDLTATVFRVNIDTGERQLIKTLEMKDPTGGFGITRVVVTPDGQSFAYNTLRQLSELYLLQGLR